MRIGFMVWTLFAYIFFWVAFFCLLLVSLIYLSDRTQIEWIRKIAGRFGQTQAEIEQIRGIVRRLGVIFLVAGMFLLLVSMSTEGISPEDQGRRALMQLACAVIVFWQIKGIRRLVRSQSPGELKAKR
jgi:hypothetical protein